jgi:hypothetical protein
MGELIFEEVVLMKVRLALLTDLSVCFEELEAWLRHPLAHESGGSEILIIWLYCHTSVAKEMSPVAGYGCGIWILRSSRGVGRSCCKLRLADRET